MAFFGLFSPKFAFNRASNTSLSLRILIVTILVVFLVNGVRVLGLLEGLELHSFDWRFQSLPFEFPDSRIVIIGITEEDLETLKEYPISDRALAQVLKAVLDGEPAVIGLDLYRPLPVEPGTSELTQLFQSSPQIIAIEKVEGTWGSGIAPPPALAKLGQTSAADAIVDQDGIVRRGFLYPMISSDTSHLPSLGLAVALNYLKSQHRVIPQAGIETGWLKLGNVVFPPLEENNGDYVATDDGGYQILINFRKTPAFPFPRVSFSEMLHHAVSPDFFQDKIVLIGSVAPSSKDTFITPFRKEIYGVELHAQIASNIISSVLDHRNNIRVLSNAQELFWTELWVISSGVVLWLLRYTRNPTRLWIVTGLSLVSHLLALWLLSYLVFAFWRLWLPVFTPTLGIFIVTIVSLQLIYVSQLVDYSRYLEQKVLEGVAKVQEAQEKVLIQEKLASLGTLVAGVSHELKNPLNFVINFSKLIQEDVIDLQKILGNYIFSGDEVAELLYYLEDNAKEIDDHANRANDIVNLLLNSSSHPLEECDVIEIIDSAIALSFPNQELEIEIQKRIGKKIPKIVGSKADLTRGFLNLLSNAAYAVTKKKESLISSSYSPLICVTVKKTKTSVIVKVWDNGLGIDKEDLRRIFDPFFTTKPVGYGVGLGLSLVYDIFVKQHEATLDINSQLGEYTEFVIQFALSVESSER